MGGYAGAFLRMGMTARAGGMGDAFSAMPGDGSAGYYNPAGTPFLKYKIFSASTMILSLDRRLNYVSYAQALPPTAGLSLAWVSANIGGLERRDQDGALYGSINQGEQAFYFSFANRFAKKISIGVSGKILYQRLYVLTSRNFGWDFGILVEPFERLHFGGMIQDIKSKYRWDSAKLYDRGTTRIDEFPRILKLGVSYEFERAPVLAAVDIVRQTNEDARIHIGIELPLAGHFAVRGGLRGKDITAGGGMWFKVFKRYSSLDYALQDVEYDIEIGHIITWSLLF